MLHQRILNEQSLQGGRKALDIIAGLLREEERSDFLHEMARVIRESIVSYEAAMERLEKKLRPF